MKINGLLRAAVMVAARASLPQETPKLKPGLHLLL